MKALSIRQPWAWAILNAGKDVENRDWSTDFRGVFAIHAAKGMTKEEYESFYYHHYDIKRPIPDFAELVRGAIVGAAQVVDCVTRSDSPWFEGKYGFVLKNVIALPEPIPCKGALSFWDVPAQIEEQLSRGK